ncbi:ATP-binding protein [Nocardioides panaciterrulae]|uniref:Putative kinase n=1 Tax=Nocardioides panaciterrulae TaxID=661492 RepID=A0A7Y9E5D2_9ACTN|nr:ATP-binding protein [Nocardioides panaciterrulae]NYD41561.1 putative kinase [Nocardioides panaciterrulae]
MSRVIFMCGPSGSGKSTYARRLERDDYRRLLEPTGVVPETIYLATDRETVLDRMRTRRGHHCDDYVLPDDVVGEYFDHFEPPTPREGPLTIIR